MRRKMFTVWSRMFVLFFLAVGVPAHAATSCAAGNPNTTSVLESTPTGDFDINGNGTVTHTKTGLMWKQCAEGSSGAACATGSATTMSWANALKAANIANTAVFAGFTDWRLPNKKELESIVEFCGFNPAINWTAFPATLASNFWSGSSYVPNPAYAWSVNFGNGVPNAYFKTGNNYVRLVRGGQSLGSFDLLGPYGVAYNGNGSTGGSVPTDGTAYASGATVTVLGNTGSLVKTGATFAGWNTAANGSGAGYAAGATFAMGAGNVTLYAQWTPIPTYSVTYNGNGSTGGSVPTDGTVHVAGATVTVLGNTSSLVKAGNTFAGWNTAANGSGVGYVGGATFAMGAGNVTLYAQWTPIPTYNVSYNGNGNTGGTVPTDGAAYATGATVTVLGNTGALVKTGATFAGWNTAANGSGAGYAAGATFAMGSGNVTLYAQWTAIPTYNVTYSGNGNTTGTVPIDSQAYLVGATVTVFGNTGNMTKTGATFAGWNTIANGGGAAYAPGNTFVMGAGNVTLHAQWTSISPTYTVTYFGNGNTGGSAPVDGNAYVSGATVTVLANTGSLMKTGSIFIGWSTQASGPAISFPATGTATFFIGPSNFSLYAQWADSGTCSLDIDGNGVIDPLTDGLMMLRATFGLKGTAVTNGAVGPGATRTTWEEIRVFMNKYCGTNFAALPPT